MALNYATFTILLYNKERRLIMGMQFDANGEFIGRTDRW